MAFPPRNNIRRSSNRSIWSSSCSTQAELGMKKRRRQPRKKTTWNIYKSDYVFNYWNQKIFREYEKQQVTFKKHYKTLERQSKSQNSKVFKNTLKELEQTRKTAYKSHRIMRATLWKKKSRFWNQVKKRDEITGNSMVSYSKKSKLGIGR